MEGHCWSTFWPFCLRKFSKVCVTAFCWTSNAPISFPFSKDAYFSSLLGYEESLPPSFVLVSEPPGHELSFQHKLRQWRHDISVQWKNNLLYLLFSERKVHILRLSAYWDNRSLTSEGHMIIFVLNDHLFCCRFCKHKPNSWISFKAISVQMKLPELDRYYVIFRAALGEERAAATLCHHITSASSSSSSSSCGEKVWSGLGF